MKEKNLSLEFLKFFAVIAVANHWMSPLYGEYSFLATGGAIGDVLFFFASGFTLFLGRFGRFDNWYKRRIKRIYPSIIAVAILLGFVGLQQMSICEIVKGGGHWFIKCIMLYYVILFFVRKYAEHKPVVSFALSLSVLLTWYFFEDTSTLFMYGETYFRWGCFFLFMMGGAYLGNKTFSLRSRPVIDGIMLVISILIFYGMLIIIKRGIIPGYYQIISLFPLMGTVIFIYKLCSAKAVDVFLRTKVGLVIRFVAGLCLEIYTSVS